MDLALSALGPRSEALSRGCRILHLIPSIDLSTGGPAEGLRNYCAAAAQLGYQFDIACLDKAGSSWFELFKAEVFGLGPVKGRYAYAPGLRPWLRNNAARYDAVIVHGCWQYVGYAAIRELPALGVPFYAFPHGMLDPWFKRTYPFKHLKKWIYWLLVEYWVIRNSRGILFTCEEEKIQSKHSFWLYQDKPIVVGYGIQPPPESAAAQRRAFLEAFPQLSTTRNFLFLGRIDPKKGCDLLIRAFGRIAATDKTLRLVMAGPDHGKWRPELEKIAREAGVADQVVWAGMLRGDLKWGAFRCAECFVLPSHQENFGVAVVEAMACEVPVLLSDKVNIWREIIEDEAGCMEPDTQAGTDRLLERWYRFDAQRRAKMGVRAKDSYINRFQSNAATQILVSKIAGSIA
jgi:glycosyltransferase involved in cell wall biosynthesis